MRSIAASSTGSAALADAIESAAELAGLESGTYMLDYVEQQLGFAERLVLSMTAKVVAGAGRVVELPRWPATVTQALESTLAADGIHRSPQRSARASTRTASATRSER